MPTIKQLCRTILPTMFTTANPAYNFLVDHEEHLSRNVTIRIYANKGNLQVASATINYDAQSWSVTMWPAHDPWLMTVYTDNGTPANNISSSAKGALDTFISANGNEVTETEFTRVAKQWLRRVLSSENISAMHANQLHATLNRDLQYARYTRVVDALWLLGFARTEEHGYAFRAAIVDGKRTTIHMRPASQPAWSREPQSNDKLPTPNTYMMCELKITHIETEHEFTIELRAYTHDDMRIEQTIIPLALYNTDHDLFRELEADMYAMVSPIVAANKGE